MSDRILKRFFFSAACALFFLNCASNKGSVNTAVPENRPAADGGKVVANEMPDLTPAAATETPKNSDIIESVYTDLTAAKCRTLKSSEDEEWIVQECPGVGGFKLEVSEGDLRQSIDVISPTGKRSELGFTRIVSSGFSSLGEKAEWRVKKTGGKSTTFALITRYNVSENPEKPEKTTSYLVVTKILEDLTCIVEIVKPVPNANEKARVSADNSAAKPCLKAK